MMETFEKLVQTRQSCRKFSDKLVETALLEQCVRTAALAPSACNSQPWSFVIVNERAMVAMIAKHMQRGGLNKFAQQAPAFIVLTEEKGSVISRLGGAMIDQQFAQIDVGLAAAHLVLQAHALGLATCILGSFAEGGVKAALGIPKARRTRLVIAVGYAAADERLREKKRKPLEQVLRVVG